MSEKTEGYVIPIIRIVGIIVVGFLFGYFFLGGEEEVGNHGTEVSWTELEQ